MANATGGYSDAAGEESDQERAVPEEERDVSAG
jgi:hypothetical protein